MTTRDHRSQLESREIYRKRTGLSRILRKDARSQKSGQAQLPLTRENGVQAAGVD